MYPLGLKTYRSQNMGERLEMRHSVRKELRNSTSNEDLFKLTLDKISRLHIQPNDVEYIRRLNGILLAKKFGEALQVCVKSQRALDSRTINAVLEKGGILDDKYEFFKSLSQASIDGDVCNTMLKQAQRSNNLSIAEEIYTDTVEQNKANLRTDRIIRGMREKAEAIHWLNRTFPQGPGSTSPASFTSA